MGKLATMLLIMLSACSNNEPKDKKISVLEILTGCGPFLSSYGNDQLLFEVVRKPTPLPSDLIVSRRLDSGQLIDRGTYTVDEAGDTVVLNLRTLHSKFEVHSYGANECALIFGTLQAANIRASWFGTWADSNDD
jgi:hypothetical protein